MSKSRIFTTSAVAFVVGLGISIPATPVQAAYSYNRAGAVAYAHQYACNGVDCHNPNFVHLATIFASNDCTNFVSQAMNVGGGLPQMVDSTGTPWWYRRPASGDTFSPSWVSVSNLYMFLESSGRLAGLGYPAKTATVSGALQGDLYMYDWGGGEGFSHFSIATGDGTFTNFSSDGKNYTDITGGKGSHMSQHSNDRDWAPWNWGYWIQTDPTIRGRMQTVVVHINSNG
jgi:hypothetical protein